VVEHVTFNHRVVGSIPTRVISYFARSKAPRCALAVAFGDCPPALACGRRRSRLPLRGGALRILITFALILISRGLPLGQASVQPANSAPNPYVTAGAWGTLPPGRAWGGTSGVHVDRDGRSIWVAERCGGNDCATSPLAPILKFDANGTLVTSFGAGLFHTPHGVEVDRDGNIWVTDDGPTPAAGKGHQVFKFSPQGRVLLTLGKAGVPGDGPDTFNRPSDVLVAPNGDVFVADGHGGPSNARIVKFSAEGKFIKTWGKKGSAPGEFDTPHGLAMDSQGRLFVADLRNHRVQIFDQEGKYLAEWKQFGMPGGLYIDGQDTLYVADSLSGPGVNPGWIRGIRIGSARDGRVTAFIPDATPDAMPITAAEGVAADAAGNVYGAVVPARVLQKHVRR
jgi:DNA-binding beta-propeller fold protein YncE